MKQKLAAKDKKLLMLLKVFKSNNDEEGGGLSSGGAAALGAVLGFASGLVGIGGGIFLTPLLILFRWAGAKTAAAISAAFIFVNSIAGLLGFLTKGGVIPSFAFWWLPAVLAGGAIGGFWGSRSAPPVILRRCLAAALAVAAIKFAVI